MVFQKLFSIKNDLVIVNTILSNNTHRFKDDKLFNISICRIIKSVSFDIKNEGLCFVSTLLKAS